MILYVPTNVLNILMNVLNTLERYKRDCGSVSLSSKYCLKWYSVWPLITVVSEKCRLIDSASKIC